MICHKDTEWAYLCSVAATIIPELQHVDSGIEVQCPCLHLPWVTYLLAQNTRQTQCSSAVFRFATVISHVLTPLVFVSMIYTGSLGPFKWNRNTHSTLFHGLATGKESQFSIITMHCYWQRITFPPIRLRSNCAELMDDILRILPWHFFIFHKYPIVFPKIWHAQAQFI